MIVNDLRSALKGVVSWREFCKNYLAEKESYLARNDGVLTSADLHIKFDAEETIIEKKDLHLLILSALAGEIDSLDMRFVAHAILLSGFVFEDEVLEDICHLLSEAETLNEVKEANSALEA